MSYQSNVIAIAFSDIHLSDRPPVARSEEPDWFKAMARPFDQIADLTKIHKCPILIAGDIFDHWKPSPKLIGFAIDQMKKIRGNNIWEIYAVPGQHDLPNHQIERIEESGYGILEKVGVLQSLHAFYDSKTPAFKTVQFNPKIKGVSLKLHGFPWGYKISDYELKSDADIDIAVVHKYLWRKGSSFPGADENSHVSSNVKFLRQFDTSIFGDNHKGFHILGPSVSNCGTLMRRSSDEHDYSPFVTLIKNDGSIEKYFLDTSKDIFEKQIHVKPKDNSEAVQQFANQLKTISDQSSLDFRNALERYFRQNKKINSQVLKIISELENE